MFCTSFLTESNSISGALRLRTHQYESGFRPFEVRFFQPETGSISTIVKAAVGCRHAQKAFELAFESPFPANPQSLRKLIGETQYEEAHAQIVKVWRDSHSRLISPNDTRVDKTRIRDTYLETARRIIAFLALIGQENPDLEFLVLFEPKVTPADTTVIPLKGKTAYEMASQLAVVHTSSLIEAQMNTTDSIDTDPQASLGAIPGKVYGTRATYSEILDYADRLERRGPHFPGFPGSKKVTGKSSSAL